MNNFDDIFVDQKTGETANNKDFVPFNKDEWAARKQQERADAYALIDRAAEDAAKDGGVFQGYLDVQSRFDRYSVGNALLITIQMPEATRLADYNGWKDNNVSNRRKCFKPTLKLITFFCSNQSPYRL